MIAQQELRDLLALPLTERLRIAQRLIESAMAEAGDKSSHPRRKNFASE